VKAAASIDEYLAGVPEDKRTELERIRGLIHAAAPDAVETIAYAMPAFRIDGRYFFGFSATKGHCSLYVGHAPLDMLAEELAPYRLWKGTINYKVEAPLSADLVTRIIEARLVEFRKPVRAR
jgi:uncharacterized protein YdhG (YjbR/CyaY superfamily)